MLNHFQFDSSAQGKVLVFRLWVGSSPGCGEKLDRQPGAPGRRADRRRPGGQLRLHGHGGLRPVATGVLFRLVWKIDGFRWFGGVLFLLPGKPTFFPKGHLCLSRFLGLWN